MYRYDKGVLCTAKKSLFLAVHNTPLYDTFTVKSCVKAAAYVQIFNFLPLKFGAASIQVRLYSRAVFMHCSESGKLVNCGDLAHAK